MLAHDLDDHFANPLGGAHDIGGINGFVGRDQNKGFCAVSIGRMRNVVGAKHIIFDGLIGTVLHQRHMLMGGGVAHDIRMVGLEKHINACSIPDGTD